MTPEEYFAGRPTALAVFERVRSVVSDAEIRTTKSQVAFRHDRGFAWLWMPGAYLKHADADVVLSIALGRRDGSQRWKQVVHVAAQHWMHHLEIHAPDEVDEQVTAWLREAAERS